MKCSKILTTVLVCAGMAVTLLVPARASINSMNLGAAYNSSKTKITFRVYSFQATYVMLYLYSAGYGVQESLTEVLSPAGNNVW
ncbi:MAG: glycogen-debranching protein, partial [Terracidiphilus sp.]